MTDHEKWADLIPFYVSGAIPDKDRRSLEAHLSACPICRADAALWKSIASEIGDARNLSPAPGAPLARALALLKLHGLTPVGSLDCRRWNACPRSGEFAIPPRTYVRGIPQRGLKPTAEKVRSSRFRLAADLVKWQVVILRREIWPSVAAVTVIGIVMAFLTGTAGVFRLIAPLIAAASLAMIYGPDNDPAFELTAAALISQGKIILARATLVFGYNLILAGIAGIILGAVLPKETFLNLILNWLGPMAFLAALALMLSLSFGTVNAVTAAYLVWFLRYLPAGSVQWLIEVFDIPALDGLVAVYRSFWDRPNLLLPLAAALTIASIRIADRRGSDRRRFATEP